MRPIPLIVVAVAGLAVGITSTWFGMRRGHDATPTSAASAQTEKKTLYWYDPMVPDQHFDHPGKSPFMDMQLVPKFAGDAGGSGDVVSIDPRQVQTLGLRTARAERGQLVSSVRASGSVAFDERVVTVVQARTAGIVERLDVRAPLTPVKQGQPLLTVLAPDWTAAQAEYLSLRRSRSPGLEDLRTAARERLLLLGMSEGQIRAVEQRGQAQTRITIVAPRDGVIGELSVREGATVAAGTPMLRINGLDTVWVNAAIPEAQIHRVTPASSVEAEFPAYPGERFSGQVESLLPDIDLATRTQTARIVLKNPGHRIAPGMFSRLTFAGAAEKTAGVLVPSEAVIATGTRSVVIVAEGDGHFRPQEVRLGDEADGKSNVIEGIKDGETVVLSGQFLIDSEASLSGTLARLGGGSYESTGANDAVMPSDDARPLHMTSGMVERIEGDHWTIAADAIASLDMGAMTMTFIKPASLEAVSIQPGQRVSFSFVRRADGAFEIRKIALNRNGGTP
ncbi:efflux RND transporter periplasmic adaptor subunit [Dokdonella sp.]|uniref:efflux RND transporter periplasmic adaptor subunit n=1 Tax=Dokdonella sp. TaxID=2291710 RepID=UPI002F4286B5